MELHLKLSLLLVQLIGCYGQGFDASIPADTTFLNLCKGIENEYCNPNWVPQPNMDQGLLGYDLASSDPYADGGDPAYRSKIFNAVEMDKDGRFSLDAGITTVDTLSCTSNEESKLVSNYKQYKGMQSFSLAIGIEGGYEGAFASVKAGMKASASMKQERSFFSSGEGMMLISEARCITYMMSVNKIIPPKFSDGFIGSLKQLEAASTSSDSTKDTLFNEFYKEWGTHYISDSKFGAKLVVQRRYSKSKMSSEQMNKAKFCLEVSVGFDVAGGAVKGNLDAKGCGSSKSNSKQGSTNSADSTKVIAIGSKPNKDGEEWAGQDFDQPQIIAMTLQPIQSLFTKDVLTKYGVDSAKINAWFTPRMKEFCKIVNKGRAKKDQLECTTKSGCGIDDNCSVDEICVTKQGGDYFCETSASAKIRGPKVLMALESRSALLDAPDVEIDLSSATCKAESAYGSDWVCEKAYQKPYGSGYASKPARVGAWYLLTLPSGKAEYISKISVANIDYSFELTKEVKVTFDDGAPEIITLPQSAVEATVSLRVPVLASKVKLEMMSFYTTRNNGYNKLRLWKKAMSHLSATGALAMSGSPELAIDGNAATVFDGTNVIGASWLQLDLGSIKLVAGVTFTFGGSERFTVEARAGGSSVKGKASTLEINSRCGKSAETTATNAAIECASPIPAKYVTLESTSSTKLKLAEVKIISGSGISVSVTANDLMNVKACTKVGQLPKTIGGPLGMLESSSSQSFKPMVLAKDSLYTYDALTNKWNGIKVNSDILGTAGSFLMFGLSDNRVWILARDQPWTHTSGSYIYDEGMIWPGFKPPVSKIGKFTGFSVVQLPSSDTKDKFFISGGYMDGAASTKAYTLEAMYTRDYKEVLEMPVHLSEHSSSIINSKFHGTEVILALGKTSKGENPNTLFYNVAKGIWRQGPGIPTTYNNEQVTYKYGNLARIGTSVVLYGGQTASSYNRVFHFHSDLNEWTVRPDVTVASGRAVAGVISLPSLKACSL